MGEYTGLRFKGIVKKEFSDFIEKMYYAINHLNIWKNSGNIHIDKYAENYRAYFIPFGSLSYMPDEWEEDNENENGEFINSYDSETRLWKFQCSLKDYRDTIEEFFEYVVPIIIEELIHCEYYYNGSMYSESYKLIDTDIIIDGDVIEVLGSPRRMVVLDNDKFKQYEDY